MSEDQSKTNTLKGFWLYLAAGRPKAWLLALFLSLIIPIVGFILVLYLIVKIVISQQKRRYALLALIVITLTAVGNLAYIKALPILREPVDKELVEQNFTTKESYNTVSTTLVGQTGLSFSKPSEFQSVDISASDLNKDLITGAYSHTVNLEERQELTLMSIVASSGGGSGSVGNVPYATYAYAIEQVLQKSQGNDYEAFEQRLNLYLQSIISPHFEITLASPKPFKNQQITTNAWTLDFTAKPKGGSSPSSERAPIVSGRLMVAFGTDTYYYFSVYGSTRNWHSHQQTWAEVFNSVKIDQ